MHVTYKWLMNYVNVGETPQAVADALTAAGVAVDSVINLDKGLQGARIGRIKEISPHPNADKLFVCSLDVGDAVLQIVTGAPNVAVGQTVPVAVPGTILPGGRTIETVDFRGVISQGMLLSPDEMGVDRKTVAAEMREGILILPEGTPLGADVVEVLGLNDHAFELDLTPNRADCLSVLGVAVDAAAIFDRPYFEPPLLTLSTDAVPEAHGLRVTVVDEQLCPGYLGLVVDDVKVGESPLWLQNRLRSVGQRPINNIVDLTNFVMLEMGQPLHAFDYAKLAGQEIIVRPTRAGEVIKTLDGIERVLPERSLAIADRDKPIAIAGIMGGLDSEVGYDTKKIVLESAWFDLKSIRRTSRAVGLRTDASGRFDKGIDPAGVHKALCRIAYLIEEMGIGAVQQPVVGVVPSYSAELKIVARPARINQLLGMQVSDEEIAAVFARLGFTVATCGEEILVTVPSRRRDITGEVDLVEEVGRIKGMNSIPTLALEGKLIRGRLTDEQKLRREIRDRVIGMGLNEIVTLSFFEQSLVEKYRLPDDHAWRKAIPIVNPLSGERGALRPSLIPGLVDVLSHNQARQVPGMACFEISRTFLAEALPLTLQPKEELRLSLGCFGLEAGTWRNPDTVYDFFYLKGVIEGLNSELSYKLSEIPFLHPGRQAEVFKNGVAVGYLGELRPRVLEALGIKSAVQIAELDFSATFGSMPITFKYRGIPRHLPTDRDMAFVLDADVPVGDAMAVIRKSGGDMLQSIRLFDVYMGTNLPAGKRSLAFRLEFVNLESTMTDDTISRATSAIVEDMERVFNAQLRR